MGVCVVVVCEVEGATAFGCRKETCSLRPRGGLRVLTLASSVMAAKLSSEKDSSTTIWN